MSRWGRAVKNERGVALVVALIALVMLSGLLITFLSMAGVEPTIADNLAGVAQARYVADAGVEWAFDQLGQNANWSGLLAANGGVVANNLALSGLPPVAGTFTVQVRNDDLPGDTALTGQAAPDAGGATNDTNGILIVTATGTVGGGTPNPVQRQIQVVTRRITLPPLPGALNFPGKVDIDSGGTAHFHSDGRNYDRDGTRVGSPLRFALTVGNGVDPASGLSYEQLAEQTLTSHQKNEFDGSDQANPGNAILRWNDEGENSIVSQLDLTAGTISDFLSGIRRRTPVTKVTPSSPLVVRDGAATDPSVSIDLGTVGNPTITYIQGTPDPPNNYATVTFEGNTAGAGLLIVEDGDVAIADTFRWDGVILITGKHVGIRFVKDGRSFVYGGTIVNETAQNDNTEELLVDYNAHGSSSVDQFTTFYSSQQNLDMVQGMRGLLMLSSWREI